MTAPTVVVKFGEGVAADAFFLVELDDALNRNVEKQGRIIVSYFLRGELWYVMSTSRGLERVPAGDVKSRFSPGDDAHLLLHYDPDKLQVSRLETTAGMALLGQMVSRQATDQVLFEVVDAAPELSHLPDGALSARWYGRSGALRRSGRVLTADAAPAIADISYSYRARSVRYVPPPMSLAGDATYPVAIVVHVEART
jgi:hypothetical protein